MVFGDNDTVHYVWNDNAQATWSWAGGPSMPQNQWAMVALTIAPARATAYVYSNGAMSSGSNDIPHIQQVIGAVQIGWVNCCGNGRRFAGLIDEVIIYDRALAEAELVELGSSGLTPVEPAGKLASTWATLKTRD